MSVVREAICTHLQGDTDGVMSVATDVYPKGAPEQGVYPLVVVKAHRAARANYALQCLSHEDSVYLVTAVDEGISSARASDLKAKIRARLDDASLEVEGYETLLVSWVQDVEYDETDKDGTKYQHEGGLYEVMVAPE